MVAIAISISLGAIGAQPHTRNRHLPPRIETCTQHCWIAIEGVRSSYHRGERVEVLVRNQTKAQVVVAVSVDGQYTDGWAQVTASVVQPDQPFTMVVRGTRIQAGEAHLFSYDPWASFDARARVIPEAERPTVLRLAVYVSAKREDSQLVRSDTFRLEETGTSH
jgi:hypothetical protein